MTDAELGAAMRAGAACALRTRAAAQCEKAAADSAPPGEAFPDVVAESTKRAREGNPPTL